MKGWRRPGVWVRGVLAAALLLSGWELLAPTLVDAERFVEPIDAMTVTDRHGTPLRDVRVHGEDRHWVRLRDVSPHLIHAVLSVEDQRFYDHPGADPIAMGRALLTNALPGTRLSGASTITQQLVKLVYGRPHGIFSKLLEVLRALALERELTKDEILEQYLNRLPFGDRIVGVGRASESYFGHPVAELTAGEAALLAGIPQAPSITEPRRHLRRALERRELVLRRMHEEGHLTDAELERELATVPHVVRRPPRPWQAARFVDRVLGGVRSGHIRPHGRELRTSLDLPLQHDVEQLVRAGVDRLRPRGVTNGAAVVVDPASGELLAYVGAARPGPGQPGGMLDLLAARRQPGSTLKPFVYELLFERGGTPATVLDDVARPATGAGGVIFETGNYDGRERGPVRARIALASSLNLAALDAARRVSAETIVARLSALGLGGVGSAERHGAAIVLGGVDVSPLELASAYVTLVRGGSRVLLTLLPLASLPEGEPVMEPAAAALTADVLADAGARRDAFGADLVLLAGGVELALKTGTSSGFRDAWTAAFTDRVVVVVWLGDPDGRALAGVSGFEGAAPVAARIVAAAHQHLEAAEAPVAPPPLEPAPICAESGMRPGPHCPHVVLERFEPGTAPEHRCDQHGPGGVWTLPPRYAAWVERSRPAGQVEVRAAAPSAGSPLRVVRPANGARWLIDPRRPPIVELVAAAGDARLPDVDWLVDGRPIETARWAVTPGQHEIVAVHHGQQSPAARVTVDQPQR